MDRQLICKSFNSCFKKELKAFLTQKRAMGLRYDTNNLYYLYNFDYFCMEYTNKAHLSKALVLKWLTSKKHDNPTTQHVKISLIKEFGRFLQINGDPDAYIPPRNTDKRVRPHDPHFFSHKELQKFFAACDSQKPASTAPHRNIVLPVLFRFLYCCGVRTGEARQLPCVNVHLNQGYIDILDSKGPKDRRIYISLELLELFKRYDFKMQLLMPGRKYFFPTTIYRGYTTLCYVFTNIWKQAGLPIGNYKPRPYDFRHHFALANLNRWIVAGLDTNVMLVYLCRYMGHKSLKSSQYYLHLVPEFFKDFHKTTVQLESLLPEVVSYE